MSVSLPPTLPVFVLSDLDDTLFNSVRKRAPTADAVPAALLKSGEVISTTSAHQRRFIDWLMRDAQLIPVTARSVEAFQRVLLPLPGPAIVSFGGVLLDAARQPDSEWAAHMRAVLAPAEEPLHEAAALLTAAIAARGLDAWARVVREHGLTQYLVIKHRQHDVAALTRLKADVLDAWAAAHPGYRIHQNDNNVALLPPGLDKAPAVAFLLARLKAEHGEIVTLGLGDSHSDAAFLALCDYAAAPQGTQLGRRLLDSGTAS